MTVGAAGVAAAPVVDINGGDGTRSAGLGMADGLHAAGASGAEMVSGMFVLAGYAAPPLPVSRTQLQSRRAEVDAGRAAGRGIGREIDRGWCCWRGSGRRRRGSSSGRLAWSASPCWRRCRWSARPASTLAALVPADDRYVVPMVGRFWVTAAAVLPLSCRLLAVRVTVGVPVPVDPKRSLLPVSVA